MRISRMFAAFAIAIAVLARAEEAPVRILVGFPPGGGSDLLGRIVAERLRGALGAPVIVENRPGANGLLAAEALKSAAPDGRTLMVSPFAVTVFAPLTQASLRYDPQRDFSPVSLAASYDLALAVATSVPAASLGEYVEWVRADRARAVYGTPTVGGPPHFFGVMLSRATGLDLQPVPYKGGPPLITDLAGGQVPAGITSLADLVPQHRAGKLRILASSGSERSAVTPEVPTFRESGYPQIEGRGWQAFHTTAGTPPPVVERLSLLIAEALRDPEVKRRLLDIGLEPIGSTPEELARRTREDVARWTPAIKASGYWKGAPQ